METHNIFKNGSRISNKPSGAPQPTESQVLHPRVLVLWDQRRERGQGVWSEQAGGAEATMGYMCLPTTVWLARVTYASSCSALISQPLTDLSEGQKYS